MRDVRALREALAKYLRDNGVETLAAWDRTRRARPGKAVAAVSLRGLEGGPGGYRDYLGERYDTEKERWEEVYGKKVRITFGVDLSGATAEEVYAGLDDLALALLQGGPEGMKAEGFSAGETTYRAEDRRYVCTAQAVFSAWMGAVTGEEKPFLDFEVRGEMTK